MDASRKALKADRPLADKITAEVMVKITQEQRAFADEGERK